jgi:hypothetical protein
VVVPVVEDEVLDEGGGLVGVVTFGLGEDDVLVLGVVLGLGEAVDVAVAVAAAVTAGVAEACDAKLVQLAVGAGPGDGFLLDPAELGPLLGLRVVVTRGVALGLTLELPVTLGLTLAEGLAPGLAAPLLAPPEEDVAGVIGVVPADVGLPGEMEPVGVADECGEGAQEVAPRFMG